MDEKLQAAVAEMICKVNDGVDASTAFLSAELPDYIAQLLMWVVARDILVIAISIVVVYLSYIATFRLADQGNGYNGMWEDSKVLMDCIGGCVSFICVGVSIASVFDLVKIVLAPKVWLVEYAASLAK